jgi:hypothetical protein
MFNGECGELGVGGRRQVVKEEWLKIRTWLEDPDRLLLKNSKDLTHCEDAQRGQDRIWGWRR